jgi:hypothetical protein
MSSTSEGLEANRKEGKYTAFEVLAHKSQSAALSPSIARRTRLEETTLSFGLPINLSLLMTPIRY